MIMTMILLIIPFVLSFPPNNSYPLMAQIAIAIPDNAATYPSCPNKIIAPAPISEPRNAPTVPASQFSFFCPFSRSCARTASCCFLKQASQAMTGAPPIAYSETGSVTAPQKVQAFWKPFVFKKFVNWSNAVRNLSTVFPAVIAPRNV